jgi:endonuclease/exonuclease/phosphatase family metal-dependent hydrolase
MVKIGTYNVNYGRPGHPRTVDAIHHLDADCLFLQETTPRWEAHCRRAFPARYRHMTFRHWRPGRAGGHGLLTRHRVIADEVLDAPTGWFPAWRVVLDAPAGPLQVLSVHLRPAFSVAPGAHRSFFDTASVRHQEIATHHARLDPALPTVVLGDFNEGDGRALAFLGERGFSPARHGQHTWRLLGWRRTYDHLFAGPGVTLADAQVTPAGASDHLPLTAQVRH